MLVAEDFFFSPPLVRDERYGDVASKHACRMRRK